MLRQPLLCAVLVLLTRLTVASATTEPPATQPEPRCGCSSAFDSLVEKLESDYIGYFLASTDARARHEARKAALRSRATSASDSECYEVLNQLVTPFNDGHLFLSEQVQLPAEETARLAASAETLPWTEESARGYLDQNAASLDPVEGIWYSDTARFAIVRDRNRAQGRDFVAVLLSSGVAGWTRGQVKAEFRSEPGEAGAYAVRYAYGDRGVHHLAARIHKNSMLRMPPVIWGKAYPLRPNEQGLVDNANPRNPTLKVLPGGAVVVSMPSHDGPYREPLERLLAQNHDALLAAPLLIADIRGNEGGGSQTSVPLAPFYTSQKKRPRPTYEGREVVVSSADQIRYFDAIAKANEPGSFYAKRFDQLVERMRREPGKLLVTDVWGNPPPPETAADSGSDPDGVVISDGPKHFAILMDRGTVSAAEAFVLATWQFERVELFGENSGGTIDYQSVQIVRVACPSLGFGLGYPTIGASEFLPRGGFNATGIPPDVRIGAEVQDPLQFIVDYYTHAR